MSSSRPITRFYFMIPVADMDRAVAFYTSALGTELRHSSPELSEVHLGDVTVCLKAGAGEPSRSTGLMIEVADLDDAVRAVLAGGGAVVGTVGSPASPVEASDTEGNVFTLVPASASPSAADPPPARGGS